LVFTYKGFAILQKQKLQEIHDKKVNDVKGCIRHFVEDAQKTSVGAAWHTLDTLEDSITQESEREIATEAIEQLCEDGILEYSDGRYYVKGNVPRF